MKDWAQIIGGILLFGAVLYGSYWLAKTVSYTIFYESMVEQTVREMVKAASLK